MMLSKATVAIERMSLERQTINNLEYGAYRFSWRSTMANVPFVKWLNEIGN